MSYSWDVVFWNEENQVSYVPSCWANPSKTLYKFPKTKNEQQLRKFLHNCEELEVDFEWHTAELKKSGIKTLKEAKKFCDKAEYTSNLDTNDDEYEKNETFSKFGRKRKSKRVSESEDELSTTSTLQEVDETEAFYDLELDQTKTNKCGAGNTTSHKNLGRNVDQSQVQTIQEQRREQTGSNSRLSSCYFKDSTLQRTPESSHKLLQQKHSSHLRRIRDEKSVCSSQSIFLSEPYIAKRAPTTSSKSKERLFLTRTRSRSLDEEPLQNEHQQNSDCLKVYRQLSELKFELKEVSQRLVNIENLLQNFLTSSSSADIVEPGEFLDALPLNSVEAIDKFNDQIKDKSKFKKLVQLLYLIGGDTPKKIIYGQMSKLITNESAKEYSAHGKQKKKCFKSLRLYNAITVATRKRIEVDKYEIMRIIGLFLTTYKSRLLKKQPTDVEEEGPVEENGAEEEDNSE